MQQIISFGSLNMDLVAVGGPIPRPGETITARELRRVPGGKGANQAVAAARLGPATAMVGRVGADEFGTALLQALAREHVDSRQVRRDAAAGSGVALITVSPDGENAISVIPGANGRVDGDDLARLAELLPAARILLLQLEIPLPIVTAAAQAAQAAGVTVILDPAPAQALPAELIAAVDILTPNQHEAETLTGTRLDSDAAIAAAAANLQQRGARTVVIKLGARGAYWCGADGSRSFHAAYPVAAVDTVAAGDAFNAGLAAALCDGAGPAQAMRWALAAGALAVTRPGAQDAMPSRTEVLALLTQPQPADS